MKIYLSLAFNHHDSSVAIADDKKILLVLEAERYFRIKKLGCDIRQMEHLILVALKYTGYSLDDVAGWSMATLNNLYLPLEKRYTPEAEWRTANILGKERKVLIVNHHLAHACSYYAFPIKEALINSCDGGGDPGERNFFYQARGNEIRKLPVDTSYMITAKFYDVASQYLYNALHSEGKLMALAAFGNYRNDYAVYLKQGIPLLSTHSYKDCFDYFDREFKRLKGTGSNPLQQTRDLASTVQLIFETERLRNIKSVTDKFNNFKNLLLVGGSALNIKLNSLLYNRYSKKLILIPPSADDSGQALGALLYYGVEVLGKRFQTNLPFLGFGAISKVDDEVIDKVANYLISGKIIAWHYGKAEVGPRALGHRSFLAPATSLKIKEVLSEKIKGREKYRPVAPIILEQYASQWFYKPDRSPFMLFASNAKPIAKRKVPGALHIDGTARIQTVSRRFDPVMFKILTNYYNATGIPLILNTSLNLRGKPLSNNGYDTINLKAKVNYPIEAFIDGEEI